MNGRVVDWLRKLVRRDLIPAKLTYFFWNSKNVFLSYLSVFFVDIGLSPSTASWVFAARIVSQFIGTIMWAVISDKTKRYLHIVVFLTIFSVALNIPQPFVAPLFACNLTNVNSTTPEVVVNKENGITMIDQLTIVLVILNILSALFEGGLSGEVDNFVVQYVVAKDSLKGYGTQRLFGSFGSGLMSLVLGFVLDQSRIHSFSKYTPIFIFHMVLMFLFFMNFFVIVKRVSTKMNLDDIASNYSESNNKNEEKDMSLRFREVIKRIDVFPFYIICFANGFGYGSNMGISFLHMRKMGASSTLMSLSLVVVYATSSVIYPFSTKIIDRIGGPLVTTAVSTFVYSVKFFAMAFITNPWGLLPVQIAQSINGALFWVAVVEYTFQKSNDNISNLMFGTLNAVYKGASRGLGIVVAGYLFERYSGRRTFLYLGIAFAVVFALNLAYVLYIHLVLVPHDAKLVSTTTASNNNNNNAFTLYSRNQRIFKELPLDLTPEEEQFARELADAKRRRQIRRLSTDIFYPTVILTKSRHHADMTTSESRPASVSDNDTIEFRRNVSRNVTDIVHRYSATFIQHDDGELGMISKQNRFENGFINAGFQVI